MLSTIPPREARQIAGENAIDVFGLDGKALSAVAARINAPTSRELSTPPSSLPEVAERSNAFRGQAGPSSYSGKSLAGSSR